MIKIKTKIGKQVFDVELPNMKSAHRFNSTYGQLPVKCTACGSENVFISYKNPGGHEYYTFECGACGAEANFGIHQNKEQSLFWKNEKMKKYVPNTPQPSKDITQDLNYGESVNTDGFTDNVNLPDDLPY